MYSEERKRLLQKGNYVFGYFRKNSKRLLDLVFLLEAS